MGGAWLQNPLTQAHGDWSRAETAFVWRAGPDWPCPRLRALWASRLEVGRMTRGRQKGFRDIQVEPRSRELGPEIEKAGQNLGLPYLYFSLPNKSGSFRTECPTASRA